MTPHSFRRHPPEFSGDFPEDQAVTEVIRRDFDQWKSFRAAGPGPAPLWSPPPAPLTVVSVTVGDGTPPDSMAEARRHAALTYIRLKVAILEAAGHGDRVDHAEHARLRGDPIAPRSTVGQIRSEAAALLLGAGAR